MSNTNVKWFESPEAYAFWLSSIPSHLHSDSGWGFAGASVREGCDKLIQGDTSRLAQAQEIISKFDVSDIVSHHISILSPSVVGYIPNVPAIIAGQPETMLNRSFVESPNVQAPLTVYVETTVSSGVSQTELINRGVAILAFVLAMEVIRPVDLYIALPHSHSKKPGVYCPVIKIASRPMDLGRAVWMLTDPCFARRLFHTAINELSGAGRRCGVGPWCWGSPFSSGYETKFRALLDMKPDDVLIKGGHIYDRLMLDNPIAWVQSMVDKHRGVCEDQS